MHSVLSRQQCDNSSNNNNNNSNNNEILWTLICKKINLSFVSRSVVDVVVVVVVVGVVVSVVVFVANFHNQVINLDLFQFFLSKISY